MTNKEIKAKMEKHKPFTPQDAMRKCGLTLRFIGAGSYREVYDIVGTNWVIKFPLTEWDIKRYGPLVDWLRKHRIHSHYELNAYYKIKTTSRMRGLRKYLPKMLWSDWKTGVIIVEKSYQLYGSDDDAVEAQLVHYEFAKHFKRLTDILPHNVGRNAKGQVKAIDLGLLEVENETSRSSS